MVLQPDIVDAVGPDVPVLGAGGIGSGRQIAASMALGSQGVWMGSIWLGTEEYQRHGRRQQRGLGDRLHPGHEQRHRAHPRLHGQAGPRC